MKAGGLALVDNIDTANEIQTKKALICSIY
jgi:hypothetical protein